MNWETFVWDEFQPDNHNVKKVIEYSFKFGGKLGKNKRVSYFLKLWEIILSVKLHSWNPNTVYQLLEFSKGIFKRNFNSLNWFDELTIKIVLQCSLDPSMGRCFKTRHSNESQCPMLSSISKQTSKLKNPKSSILSAVVKASPSTTSNQKKLRFQLAKERKASTTLGIIMSAFTFCWLPFFVLALIRPFLDQTSALDTLGNVKSLQQTVINYNKIAGSIFLWLGYANSLFNPIIYATLNRDFRKPFKAILYFRCGSLNHMMREDFYHSQYGDPEQHPTRYHLDYEEGVEYIEAEGEEVKASETETAARESFLWLSTFATKVRPPNILTTLLH